jgi:hypothetical protein
MEPERKNQEMTDTETATPTAVVAGMGATAAPEKGSSKKDAAKKKGAPKAAKTAKTAAPKKSTKATNKVVKGTPRTESKAATILEMMSRAKGATLAEIMKATDWQAHSVRGFISTAGKKHGINIESSKNENGDRVYQIGK